MEDNNQESSQLHEQGKDDAKKAASKIAAFSDDFRKIVSDKKSRELLKKTAKKAKDLGKVLFKALISVFGSLIGPSLIIIIILITILNCLPFNTWLVDTSTSVAKDTFTKTERVLQTAYSKQQKTASSYLSSYLNETYSCDFEETEIDGSSSSYSFNNETNNTICNVTVKFTPSATSIVNIFNAYASGVNGVLSYISSTQSDTESNSADFSTDMIWEYANSDDDGKENIISNIREDLKENGSEYESIESTAFTNSIANRSSSIFFPETDSNNWVKDVNSEYDKIVGYNTKQICTAEKTTQHSCAVLNKNSYTYQQNCKSSKDKYSTTSCVSYKDVEDKDNPIKKDVHEIGLTIQMNYDISSYKKEEFDSAVQEYADENGATYDEAYQTLYELLMQYSDNYLSNLAYNTGDGDSYTEYTGAISGVNAIFFENGEEGWEGHFTNYATGWDKYESYGYAGSGSLIWNHIENSPVVSSYYWLPENAGIRRQCVTFSKGWIYDAYGIAFTALGNGQDVVATLVGNGWTLLNTPAPGSIFSASATASNPYGHTGVIIAVENGVVTYMDGNAGNARGIRIRTMTVEQMMTTKFGSPYIKFAVKK